MNDHLAAEAVERLAHDVEADAAPGDFGDRSRGADAAAQQQADELLGAELAGARAEQAPADGDALHGGEVEAPPVVAAFEDDPPAAAEHVDAHAAGARLAKRNPFSLRFRPMRHRVAHDLRQRPLHGGEDV